MSTFNPDFWEIPTDSRILDSISKSRSLWHETPEDSEARLATQEFFERVLPIVREIMAEKLTPRQYEITILYFFEGLTQEKIADMTNLDQCTVSRHLFGTKRDGKLVGGAVRKLKKIMDGPNCPPEIREALDSLNEIITSRFSLRQSRAKPPVEANAHAA